MKKTLIFTVLSFIMCATMIAQVMPTPNVKTNKKDGGYQFTIIKENTSTPIKDQGKSGTCWTFSSNGFLESEIIRSGKEKTDLSEMFIVRNQYMEKARNYIRMLGKTNFAEGGEFHDVINNVHRYGIVPQEAYAGKQEKIDHSEMDGLLKAMLDQLIKIPGGKISDNWDEAIAGVLDAYLGKAPEKFDYNGKTYTPQSFAKEIGINADDYIGVTSFTHHPYYDKFVLEVPDNWSLGMLYNVPINELEQITDNALQNGYTIAWASDVSEKGFSYKNGVAILPAKDFESMSKEEKETMFDKPAPEKTVTAEMRQAAFDNLTTQDDHGMQITGIAKDQNGNKYYVVKNSWGESNDCGGYFYVSAPYYLYKTTSILLHKNAIPKDITKKMKL